MRGFMQDFDYEKNIQELRIMRLAISTTLQKCKPILQEILTHQQVTEYVTKKVENDRVCYQDVFIAPNSF